MLKTIYRTGSKVIGIKGRDSDLVKIYETREEAREALFDNRDKTTDWHFDSLDRSPRITLYSYQYPFVELVEGEDIESWRNFSIFEHKDEIVEMIKRYLNLNHSSKLWYHIVVYYFMFKKGKTTLTKKELAEIQNVHDNGISDKMYECVIEYFK